MSQQKLRIGWKASEVDMSSGRQPLKNKEQADPISRLQFCVVSENPFFRKSIRQMFQSAGIWSTSDIRTFDEGTESLKAGSRSIVALIVDCDQQAHGATGFIRSVRRDKDAQVARLPIIAVTDDAVFDQIEAICALGVEAVLLRPFSTKGLMMRVSKVLKRPRKARAASIPVDTIERAA